MTTETRPDGTWRAGGSRVAWRQTSDEIVLLDLDQSTYFGLNRSGAALWTRLVDGATTHELVALLITAGADPAAAAVEVDAFLAMLEAEHFLSRE